MRYYVLFESDLPDVGPYILAEVVRDHTDTDRELSLAATLAGSRAVVATRLELLRSPEGRIALELWEARDDTAFELENELLTHAYRGEGARLRVVDESEREPSKRTNILPSDPEHRDLVLRARGMRAVTRSLVQRARERRIEMHEIDRSQDGMRLPKAKSTDAIEPGGLHAIEEKVASDDG